MSKKSTVSITVSLETAHELVKKFMADSKIFAALNINVKGEPRLWSINPKAGRGFIVGGQTAQTTNPNHVKVFDMRAAQPRGEKGRFAPVNANGWRTLNPATLVSIKKGNTTYWIDRTI